MGSEVVEIKESVVTVLERFSTLSAVHEKKMRIISGITGLNLLREGKHDEASGFIESFVKLKDYPLEYLAVNLNPQLPADVADLETGARLLEIAKKISTGNLSDEDMSKYSDELAGILHEARSAGR